jgi:hypothetical protein
VQKTVYAQVTEVVFCPLVGFIENQQENKFRNFHESFVNLSDSGILRIIMDLSKLVNNSSRSADEIRSDLVPSASKKEYLTVWNDFCTWSIINNGFDPNSSEPAEDLYLMYFDFLRPNRAVSTLWKTYSILNKLHKVNWGQSLKKIAPALEELLKKLDKESTKKKKKAKVFTQEEIFKFLDTASNSGKELLWKVVTIAGYFGALRTCELTQLTFSSVERMSEGMWFKIDFPTKTNRSNPNFRYFVPEQYAKVFDMYKTAVGGIIRVEFMC